MRLFCTDFEAENGGRGCTEAVENTVEGINGKAAHRERCYASRTQMTDKNTVVEPNGNHVGKIGNELLKTVAGCRSQQLQVGKVKLELERGLLPHKVPEPAGGTDEP